MRIVIEGGGDSPVQDEVFRREWARFFASAGVTGELRIVRGQGRSQAWAKFQEYFPEPESALLLVDSERVPTGESAWQHLSEHDEWAMPVGADKAAFLMICAMETWIVSDPQALAAVFPDSFNASAISEEWPDYEKVTKARINDALSQLTGGAYKKGVLSYQVLEALNPTTVEGRCPAAKTLLERLRAL